jgi:hypothetical protein
VTYRQPSPPPTPSTDEIFAQFEGIFQELLGPATGDRAVAYVPSAKKASRGGRATVKVERFRACDRCTMHGCADCDYRGGRSETAKLAIELPPDVPEGHQVILAGEGDPGVGGKLGKLVVVVTHDPVRAAALEARDASYLARCKEAIAQARATRVAARRRTRTTLLGVGIAAAAIAAIVGIAHLSKGVVGDGCRYSADCRSGQCLMHDLGAGGVCTTSCSTNDDCPGAMKCASVHQTAGPFDVHAGAPNARACSR